MEKETPKKTKKLTSKLVKMHRKINETETNCTNNSNESELKTTNEKSQIQDEIFNLQEKKDLNSIIEQNLDILKEISKAKEKINQEKREWKKTQKVTLNNEPELELPNIYLKDPDTIFSGLLKIRSALKDWKERFFILKPKILMYFKNQSDRSFLGIISLKEISITQREKAKEQFTFKLYHTHSHSIFLSQGPKGEFLPSGINPLSCTYCILRAKNAEEMNEWINFIQIAKGTSNSAGSNEIMIKDNFNNDIINNNINQNFTKNNINQDFNNINQNFTKNNINQDFNNDFNNNNQDFTKDNINQDFNNNSFINLHSSINLISSHNNSLQNSQIITNPNLNLSIEKAKKVGTEYTPFYFEDKYKQGEHKEKIEKESSSLLITLLKQLRIGMDLSKVVLPTFVLEPRSTLEKLSDYMAHGELLFSISQLESPEQRIIQITKWYLSGFYLKPEGCKKPYNPILGEYFRCMWDHGDSKTHYIAEQVSHHPPISAFYCSNRKKGFAINGSIRFDSKFYGTSAGSVLVGSMNLHCLPFNEDYEITFPTAIAKGLFFGTLSMELVGSVSIIGKQTNYRINIDFKEKPMIGGEVNVIHGKIFFKEELIFTIKGKWDGEIMLTNIKTEENVILWVPSPEIRKNRIPIQKPVEKLQGKFESNRLWQKVTEAILQKDQIKATQEKYVLEQAQRYATRIREATGKEWIPRLFLKNGDQKYIYKFLNHQQWEEDFEAIEFETDHGCIKSFPIANDIKSHFEHTTHLIDSINLKGEITDDSSKKESISFTEQQYENLLLKVSHLENLLETHKNQSMFKDPKFVLLFLIFIKLFLFIS